jgi:hypothetical protein
MPHQLLLLLVMVVLLLLEPPSTGLAPGQTRTLLIPVSLQLAGHHQPSGAMQGSITRHMAAHLPLATTAGTIGSNSCMLTMHESVPEPRQQHGTLLLLLAVRVCRQD